MNENTGGHENSTRKEETPLAIDFLYLIYFMPETRAKTQLRVGLKCSTNIQEILVLLTMNYFIASPTESPFCWCFNLFKTIEQKNAQYQGDRAYIT